LSSDFIDPYLNPSTGVLRNLVGATSYDELANAEGELVTFRTGEFLEKLPIKVTGSLGDLKAIHRWLFQDVYDWAGQTRTVEIRKLGENSQFFLPSTNIEMGVNWAQGELAKDGMLKGMDKRTLVQRLSFHYDNYNFAHPFREGNGRTQRLSWTLICHDAGFDLDWRKVSGEENDEASRLAAEELDRTGLESMFDKIATPCDPDVPINAEMLEGGHLS